MGQITNSLGRLVQDFRKTNYGEYPKLIVMTVESFKDLEEEFREELNYQPKEGKDLKFMGVKVVRTSDIRPDELYIL